MEGSIFSRLSLDVEEGPHPSQPLEAPVVFSVADLRVQRQFFSV